MRDDAKYVLITDGACDLPQSICEQEALPVIPLYYTISSASTHSYPDTAFHPKEFYQMLRSGIQVQTAAPSIEDCKSYMQPILEAGKDILYIGFSSALSGTFNVIRLATMELAEAFPERSILTIDSGSASLGEGLLLMQAMERKKAGCTLEETAAFVKQLIPRLRSWFTVDDLLHLKRGGRIGSGTALVGTMLQIKPLLRVGANGKLESFAKARGKRNALKQLADLVGEHMTPGIPVCISHADALEDANFVRDILRRVYHATQILVNDIDPAVGGHGGPGAVAAFCIGKTPAFG